LRLEKHNYDAAGNICPLYFLGISAKQYVLFSFNSKGKVVIRKPSEHGLGQLLSPHFEDEDELDDLELEEYIGQLLENATDEIADHDSPEYPLSESPQWINDVWLSIISAVRSHRPLSPPAWADRIAIARLAFTQPSEQKALGGLPGMKPTNFITVAYPSPWGRRYLPGFCTYEQREVEQCPRASRSCPFREQYRIGRPVRPGTAFLPTAEGAQEAEWVDLHTGDPLPIAGAVGEDGVVLKTFADLIHDYYNHPEAKAVGSRGELHRVHVVATGRRRIGKEGHRFDDRRVLLNPGLHVYLHYVNERAAWKWAGTVLPTMPQDLLEEYSTMSGRKLRDAVHGRSNPHQMMRAWLIAIARAWEQSKHDIEELRRCMGPTPAAEIRKAVVKKALRAGLARWLGASRGVQERTLRY